MEDPDEPHNPLTSSREQRIAQLHGCLDLVAARLRTWVRSLDDLEDCRASVLDRVWNSPIVEQLIAEDRITELNCWLQRCVRNELLSCYRSRNRAAALRAKASMASATRASPYEFIDFRIQLQHTLKKLQPDQARLFNLAYVEGLPPEEIAQLEGRSLIAVTRAISRAREAFRNRWDSEEL